MFPVLFIQISVVFGYWRFQLVNVLHNAQRTHAHIIGTFSAFAYFTFGTWSHLSKMARSCVFFFCSMRCFRFLSASIFCIFVSHRSVQKRRYSAELSRLRVISSIFVYFSVRLLTDVVEPKLPRHRTKFAKKETEKCHAKWKNQTEDTSHSHFEPPPKSSLYRQAIGDRRSTRNAATTLPSLRLIILTKLRAAGQSLWRSAHMVNGYARAPLPQAWRMRLGAEFSGNSC